MILNASYEEFLANKAKFDPPTGVPIPGALPDQLFGFQYDITRWALRRGRAALFAGTGLGKSFMELAWGQQVSIETKRPVLHLAPLAVSAQMVREANKFGIPARIADPDDFRNGFINITNYQRAHHFDFAKCGGVILDESSILKNDNGHYCRELIALCDSIPFRLAATATPAPNDFMELGTHAEFLGVMSKTDMLATFFVHDGGSTQSWRLKGHAEQEFWRWMATWAVMLRKPSDLGYSNDGYDLPPLNYHMHKVSVTQNNGGGLFAMQAQTLSERISARRDSVDDRVKKCFSVVIGNIVTTLEQCHGNQNTQSAEGQNINQTNPSEKSAEDRGVVGKKTPNICEGITPKTNQNTSGRQNNKRKSTEKGEKDTQPIPNTGTLAEKHQIPEVQMQEQRQGLNRHTELQSKNTTVFANDKVESAQSADASQSENFMLTTAMKAALSEDCFAARAIQGLDISKMTRNGSIEQWCIWCNLNSEQDALAKAFGPLAFSVKGSMSEAEKETAILAWIDGERPIMLSKPSIMGFGMNFQHCRNTAFIGLNDSWEQFYQAVRRFWRFGQVREVNCHIIAAETEGATIANIKRKEADAERMANAMVMHMADLTAENVRGSVREKADYNPTQEIILPNWLN